MHGDSLGLRARERLLRVYSNDTQLTSERALESLRTALRDWEPTATDCPAISVDQSAADNAYTTSFRGKVIDTEPTLLDPAFWEIQGHSWESPSDAALYPKYPLLSKDKEKFAVYLRDALHDIWNDKDIGYLFLDVADRFVIFHDFDRFGRFIGWTKHGDEDVLLVSAGYFYDKDNIILRKALLTFTSMMAYEQIRDHDYVNDYVIQYKGKTIVGSFYPDSHNDIFFRDAKKVIDLAEGIARRGGRDFAESINSIDLIYYQPYSTHFNEDGVVFDQNSAYVLSAIQNAVFIRRNSFWSSTFHLAIDVLHEGRHLVQFRKLAEGDPSFLGTERLEKVGKIVSRLMEEGVGDVAGMHTAEEEQKLVLECDATKHEIEFLKFFDAPPSLLDTAGYITETLTGSFICPDERVEVVAWKDERLREGIKALPK